MSNVDDKENEEMQRGMTPVPTVVVSIILLVLTGVVSSFYYSVSSANARREEQITQVLVSLSKVSTNQNHIKEQLATVNINIRDINGNIREIDNRVTALEGRK